MTDCVTSDEDTEAALEKLLSTREIIRCLEEEEKSLRFQILLHMDTAQNLVNSHGRVLATWKKPKDSVRLNADMVKSKYPDVYKECLVTSESSRRFVPKYFK